MHFTDCYSDVVVETLKRSKIDPKIYLQNIFKQSALESVCVKNRSNEITWNFPRLCNRLRIGEDTAQDIKITYIF